MFRMVNYRLYAQCHGVNVGALSERPAGKCTNSHRILANPHSVPRGRSMIAPTISTEDVTVNDNLPFNLTDHTVPVHFGEPDGADFVVQVFSPDVYLNIVGRVAGEAFPLRFLKEDSVAGTD